MRRILVGLVLVVLVAVGAVVFYYDRIATTAIERGGREALGVDTHLGSFFVRPFLGSVRLGDLRIANPAGFESPQFLAMDSGTIQVALRTLREDPIVIERVELRRIELALERGRHGTNYGKILQNIEQMSSGSEEAAGPGIVIRELVIRDVDAHVALSPIGGKLTELDVEIPEIRLTNVGASESDGAEMQEVMAIVTKAVLRAVAKKGALPASLAADLNRRLARVGIPPIALPGELGEKSQELSEKLGKAGEQAERMLDLFKPKK